MNNKEEQISNKARDHVRKNAKTIVKKFADPAQFPPADFPVSVFMAGSPGAGKTEFSKELLNILFAGADAPSAVRIDADEVREVIPGYEGGNAYLFQSAVSLAVEKIHDAVLSHKQNFVLDGTLAQFEKAKDNIQRSLNKKRTVLIFYIYQDPIVAWDFTQRREEEEGRRIPRDAFIDQFFSAKDTVNKLKKVFSQNVTIYLVEKNFKNQTEKILVNISNIDDHILITYTNETLKKSLEKP